MAMEKRHKEILDRLDAIEAILAGKVKTKSSVTKKQLTDIKGVGDALADEILKVINSG
jgi:endonuclease III-like uncharacterized protein